MSLVDYASSSSDDEDEEPKPAQQHRTDAKSLVQPQPLNRKSSIPSVQQSETEPSTIKLPDASILLGSPALPSNMATQYDHTSRVAAAMAENASRKRDSKGITSTEPRSKLPRGSLPHSRSFPDTAGGLLRPPQLSGRSNVVTEDISKLFVKRNAEPSSTRSPV